MTVLADGEHLVDRGGWTGTLDAVVVGCVWVGGRAAMTDGEGRVAWIDPERPGIAAEAVHDGAILAATASPDGKSLITGGDDGRLVRHGGDGEARTLLHVPGRWIEHLVLSASLGLGVAAVGKEAVVFDVLSGATLRRFAHTSTIGGLALDPKGRRVAATHYGGVTLWWLGIDGGNPRRLNWPGSHLSVTWSPNGRFVVTAMQEPTLHGWRLDDGADMRMSGYATKTHAFSWSPKGRWLATGGAPQAVCWPFASSDGPMGKRPLACGAHGVPGMDPAPGAAGDRDGEQGPVVTRVAFHPTEDVLAVGYEDGWVELVRLADGGCVPAIGADGAPVTALAWDRGGSLLACGGEAGRVALIRIGGGNASASGGGAPRRRR